MVVEVSVRSERSERVERDNGDIDEVVGDSDNGVKLSSSVKGDI